MKVFSKILSLLLVLCLSFSLLVSCGKKPDDSVVDDGSVDNSGTNGGSNLAEWVDYASTLKLDMSSDTLKAENVTVKGYIDGDTTHFYVSRDVNDEGVVKARYLAINTPESTGRIEPWGKAAAKFTREKLESATSLILESDNNKWNIDSTGERYLVWVWYKTSENGEYRNLNLEILQAGYAIASNAAQNRYGELATTIISQAIAYDLYVYSKEKDPSFPYGLATEVTLKELRQNIEDYDGQLVAFNGVVTMNDSGSILVEDYDEETDMYYGMTIYYGTSGLNSAGLRMLVAGNELRIVGVVSYWEGGGVYQVSSLEYKSREPDNPRYIKLLSEGNEPSFRETTIGTLNSKVTVIDEEGNTTEMDYANLALNTSVLMKNLKVVSTYTTKDGDSKGAISITCQVDGKTIVVRTSVLYDDNGKLITEDIFQGKTIDVQGFVDYYNGTYQLQLFTMEHVTIH